MRLKSGEDPGCSYVHFKVLGFALLILSHFSEISHENEIRVILSH